MADDFKKTAEVMYDSAFLLWEAREHRNACYLAGYVVECALKAMLLVRYDLANTTRPPATARPGGYRTHDLGRLDSLLTDHALNAERAVLKYGLPLQIAAGIGTGWDPNHRYDGTNWATADGYLDEADQVIDILNFLTLDGVLM